MESAELWVRTVMNLRARLGRSAGGESTPQSAGRGGLIKRGSKKQSSGKSVVSDDSPPPGAGQGPLSPRRGGSISADI